MCHNDDSDDMMKAMMTNEDEYDIFEGDYYDMDINDGSDDEEDDDECDDDVDDDDGVGDGEVTMIHQSIVMIEVMLS